MLESPIASGSPSARPPTSAVQGWSSPFATSSARATVTSPTPAHSFGGCAGVDQSARLMEASIEGLWGHSIESPACVVMHSSRLSTRRPAVPRQVLRAVVGHLVARAPGLLMSKRLSLSQITRPRPSSSRVP